jgi:hypothetical protein
VDPDPAGRDRHSHRHKTWGGFLWRLEGLVLLMIVVALVFKLLLQEPR